MSLSSTADWAMIGDFQPRAPQVSGTNGLDRVCSCLSCHADLHAMAEGLSCTTCGRTFPNVAGLPDLRDRSDRFLDLTAERAKAERLAALEPGLDVIGLARAYYAMTSDVDASRRVRYLAHITGAERRGAALASLLPASGRVLEIGCGTGGFLAAAARRGIDVTGVDIAARWLVIARRRLADRSLRVPLIAAGAETLPWPDGRFDAVVADSVLEHLDDPGPALREWLRVVRPGGRLLIWSPNCYSILTDPHVGLWGVGFLPRRWASAYVRLRRGCDWTVNPLGPSRAARLAREAGWSRVEVGPAKGFGADRGLVAAYRWASERAAMRTILKAVGPLWQLDATRPGR